MAIEPNDQELIERIRRDRDQQAMAALYDRYARPVYSLAIHILREPRAAEDVVQDVFLTFWQRPSTYINERGAFSPWILRVTRNRAIDLLRRRSRERYDNSDEHTDSFTDRIVDPDPDPIEQVWNDTVARQIRHALAELSPPQRQVIELAYFYGMTQSEMATHLNIPIGTIKTRVRTALRRLSEIITETEAWTDRP